MKCRPSEIPRLVSRELSSGCGLKRQLSLSEERLLLLGRGLLSGAAGCLTAASAVCLFSSCSPPDY